MVLGKAVDSEALLRDMRDDGEERDEFLRKALTYLSRRGVTYRPLLEIEEGLNASYENDSLEEFQATVRRWIRDLVKEAA
jgi:uncharacterized NAD(P)/FAD-binding protein YdhS